MNPENKSEAQQLRREALYKEYETRTREIEISVQRYHRLNGFVQIYLVAIYTLSTYIYFTKPEFFQLAEKNGLHGLEIFVALILMTIFLFFLNASMMDTVYMLNVNGARVAAIEREINKSIKSETMIWENKIVSYMLTDKWWVANGALRPQPIVFIWVLLLFSISVGVLSYFCYKFSSGYFVFMLFQQF